MLLVCAVVAASPAFVAQAPASARGEAYYLFLHARKLEGEGDIVGGVGLTVRPEHAITELVEEALPKVEALIAEAARRHGVTVLNVEDVLDLEDED